MSIRKQYDTDLEALKAALVEMGSNSAEAVEAALEALCTAAAEAATDREGRQPHQQHGAGHRARCMTCCCASSRWPVTCAASPPP